MATLEALFAMKNSALRNRITAAGWNKGKDIVVGSAPGATELAYARDLLRHGLNEEVITGVIVLLQDEDDPSEEQVQTAVGQVVDKFVTLEA